MLELTTRVTTRRIQQRTDRRDFLLVNPFDGREPLDNFLDANQFVPRRDRLIVAGRISPGRREEAEFVRLFSRYRAIGLVGPTELKSMPMRENGIEIGYGIQARQYQSELGAAIEHNLVSLLLLVEYERLDGSTTGIMQGDVPFGSSWPRLISKIKGRQSDVVTTIVCGGARRHSSIETEADEVDGITQIISPLNSKLPSVGNVQYLQCAGQRLLFDLDKIRLNNDAESFAERRVS